MKTIVFFILSLTLITRADELIKPIPLQIYVNTEKASLGEKLFFDTRLSRDDTIACVSCHNIVQGGADTTPVSFGVEGRSGTLNSPTVFNSIYNIAQFWDGRAEDLQQQASGPIQNHVEMDSNEQELIKKLSTDNDYTKAFNDIYPDGITLDNITNAIAEYEKTLITPNARFDKFLRGDVNAISKDEKAGYMLFKNYGCISCHNGINIGSNMFQKFGIFKHYQDAQNSLGRYNVTKNEVDKYYFKVPTLRNIVKTAPYFHDGSAQTLEEAVNKMGRYQLGRNLSKEDIAKLVLFLHTLTGEIPQSNSKDRN